MKKQWEITQSFRDRMAGGLVEVGVGLYGHGLEEPKASITIDAGEFDHIDLTPQGAAKLARALEAALAVLKPEEK